jgi:tartrate-resistant acid phosphatase type 5
LNSLFLNRREVLAAAPALAVGLSSSAWAREPSSLSFLVVGDWGRDGGYYQPHVAREMGRAAERLGSAFIVSTGDNFYKLGVLSEFDPQWESSFERVYTETSLQVPWYPVLGNHDYGGDIEAQLRRTEHSRRWHMPTRWYPVRKQVGDIAVDLFFLDTVAWLGRESFPYRWLGSPIRKGDQEVQREWLVQSLRGSSANVKLVFGHHPIFSVGPHGGGINMPDLDSVLRLGGVTAYIHGHDHCLYHIEHDGMHYVCSGGGSEELAKYTGDRRVHGCVLPTDCGPRRPSWRQYLGRAGFAAFTISGDGCLGFQFIDRDGLRSPAKCIAPTAARSPLSFRSDLRSAFAT